MPATLLILSPTSAGLLDVCLKKLHKPVCLKGIFWGIRFLVPQIEYGFGYIRIRSPYAPYSFYLRGTIGCGVKGSGCTVWGLKPRAKASDFGFFKVGVGYRHGGLRCHTPT